AGALLAVAHGGIEYDQFFLAHGSLQLRSRTSGRAREHRNQSGFRSPGRTTNNEFRLEYLARDAQQQAGQQGAGKKEQHRGLVRGTHIVAKYKGFYRCWQVAVGGSQGNAGGGLAAPLRRVKSITAST